MCYKKPGPRCSSHARTALKSALASGNEERIKEAKKDYMLTPEGIRKVFKNNPAMALSLEQQRNAMIENSKRVHGEDNADLGEGVQLPKASFRERHSRNVAMVARLQQEIAIGAQNANEVARNSEHEEVRQYANGYRQAMEDFLSSFGREYKNAEGVDQVRNDEEYTEINRNLFEKFAKTEPEPSGDDEAYNLGYRRAIGRFSRLTEHAGYEASGEDFALYTAAHLHQDSRGKIDPTGITERNKKWAAEERARIDTLYSGETVTSAEPARYRIETPAGGSSGGFRNAEEAVAEARSRKQEGITDGVSSDWTPVEVVQSRTDRRVPDDQQESSEGATYYLFNKDGGSASSDWNLQEARQVLASQKENNAQGTDDWIVIERQDKTTVTPVN